MQVKDMIYLLSKQDPDSHLNFSCFIGGDKDIQELGYSSDDNLLSVYSITHICKDKKDNTEAYISLPAGMTDAIVDVATEIDRVVESIKELSDADAEKIGYALEEKDSMRKKNQRENVRKQDVLKDE